MTGRPRLRGDLVIVEQVYRGEQTYIVKDPRSHKYFRFKPLEVLIMQQFTGEHSLEALAEGFVSQGLPVSAATLRGFADRLRRMELLERSLQEKSVLQLERLRAERRRRVQGTHYNGSLLRMRWSAGDPDELFDRHMPWLRAFFSPAFIAVSVLLFLVYTVVFIARWPDVADGIVAMYSVEFYTLENILLFWGTAMVVIVIHELGHGVACKYFGGQVHEMGAMLIYFQPAFYCNVNDAWTFPKLSHRLWVTAAGSWIQLVVAGIAAVVWVVVDPGSVIARVAFFAVLVGGATTILANANPLIPLDGYYALSDWLEVPNLRQRALGYIAWLVKRYVLRLQAPEPDADPRERRIFVIYGVLALAYITLILTAIGLIALGWLSGWLGPLGVLGFALLLWLMLRRHVIEWGRNVMNAVREHRDRLTDGRRLGRWGAGALAVLIVLLLVPWPLTVTGRVTVAAEREVALTAPDGGVLAAVYAGEGERVAAGEPVARLRHPALERRLADRERVVDSLTVAAARLRAAGRAGDARQAELALAAETGRRDALRIQVHRLTVRAPLDGVVVTPRLEEHVGRSYESGAVVAELAAGELRGEVLFTGAGAGYVAAGQSGDALFALATGVRVSARVESVRPAAGNERLVRARLWLADPSAVRLGMAGTTRIMVRRSSLLGALWWGLRKRLRNDLLL